MSKRVLILGAGFEFCGLVKKAKAMDCYTVVCDGYLDAPAKELADKAYTVDIHCIDEIVKICKQEMVDNIVTSFSDILFEYMIKISAKAGLPCYVDPAMISAYRDKFETKTVCKKVGIHVPKFIILKKNFTDDQISEFHFPCVIKPINGYGSRGLKVVHNIQEIRDNFSGSDVYEQGEILMEEMSRGQELNVMGYVIDGKVHIISIADRKTQQVWDNYIPVLYAVSYPSRSYDLVHDRLSEMLSKFVAYTGQKEGPIATQCFWNGTEIEVCEIAGRYFGFEHELVEYCNGFDIEQLLLDQRYNPERAKSAVLALNAKGTHCSTGIYLQSVRNGEISNQNALRDLAKLPEVAHSVLFYEDGENVGLFGPKQYAARYFLVTDAPEEMNKVERCLFTQASMLSTSGEELLWKPTLT